MTRTTVHHLKLQVLFPYFPQCFLFYCVTHLLFFFRLASCQVVHPCDYLPHLNALHLRFIFSLLHELLSLLLCQVIFASVSEFNGVCGASHVYLIISLFYLFALVCLSDHLGADLFRINYFELSPCLTLLCEHEFLGGSKLFSVKISFPM